ncbi:S-adenosyl-L-methionine-dependent methyltransferase [Amylocarpus encephaloides]|uniref:S-adenosyl-L-methionine-dependent methyltransferase n=1 Tax=Amylocarpus encephaloides TaxID=45428 RepID=A0A9P7YIL3_9HELO|nr:S-adenosyl-L-methionine-dependent methyltransferase [Amylocarpus encephaloides]
MQILAFIKTTLLHMAPHVAVDGLSEPATQAEQPGFSAPGFCWADYIEHRPMYPTSFWERVYTYHAQSSNNWGIAHDVGAGAGIASEELANRFQHVIVSDPNDGYVDIASRRLRRFGFPPNKFAFLQEGAEESSVRSQKVDLLTICEAWHWTDVPRAMDSFARQVKPGGTLAISFYGMPQFIGNERAQRVWDEIIDIWAHRLHKVGGILERGVRYMSAGLDAVPLSSKYWEPGAKRITIDTGCKMKPLSMNLNIAPKGIGGSDMLELVENDRDWLYKKDIVWLKGFFATLLPRVMEEEIQELWTEVESAVDGGEFVISWPLEQVLATRRWDGGVARL